MQKPSLPGEPEHRLVLALAQAASGDAPRDAAFEPLLCADAGWYLLLHAPQPEPGT